MASSPPWKVYRADGEYVAAVKSPMYGAMILAGLGERGATIRLGHNKKAVAWTDMVDGNAAESYDAVAIKCLAYHDAANRAGFAAAYGEKALEIALQGVR